MARSWQFISCEADGRLDDPKARRAVRENAMRAFRRSQRLQLVKESQERQAQALAQDDSQLLPVSSHIGSSCLAPTEAEIPITNLGKPSRNLEEDHAGLSEIMSLEIGSGLALDPFSSTALYSHHEAPQLFSHCMFSVSNHLPKNKSIPVRP
jgi:hypothetical protein